MKLFNKKKKLYLSKSKGNVFIRKLEDAIKYNKDKDEFKLKFREILNRADDMKYHRKGVKIYNNNLIKKKLKETISKSDLMKQLDEFVKMNEQFDNGKTNFNLVAATNQAKGRDILLTKKKSKFQLKIQKIKLRIKRNWEITKQIFREIKYWAIAEYEIIRKLKYAISRKKQEAKISRLFESNMVNFINQYGYEIGMKKYNRLVKGISYSVNFEKRLVKGGY